jgi:hypothetical protein
MVEDRATALRRAVRSAPTHVSDEPSATPTDAPMEPPRQASETMRPQSRAEEIRDSVRRSLDDADATTEAEVLPPLRIDRG